jgi:hypothetical protein
LSRTEPRQQSEHRTPAGVAEQSAARTPEHPGGPAGAGARARGISGPGDLLGLQRTIGNRAVLSLMSEVGPEGGDGTIRVSRVMDLTAFTSATDQKGKRNKIKLVDDALTAYRGLPAEGGTARLAAVQTLITECQNYLALLDKDATRKPGVRLLLPQAQAELTIYTPFAAAEADGNPVRKVQLLHDALEAYVGVKRTRATPVQEIAFQTVLGTAVGALDGVQKKALVDRDADELNALSLDVNVPAPTRAILTEVLANRADVKLEVGTPGAKSKRPWEAQPEGYTVSHALDPSGGKAERLGSLAHELTHVSVGESYENSSFFLMIEAGATDHQILAKAQGRQTRVNEIRAALAANTTLAPDQRALVLSKVDYAEQDKLPLYVSRYADAGRAARATEAKGGPTAATAGQKGDFYEGEVTPMTAVVNALQAAHLPTSLLVEYDTVINQILVYLHLWQVPQGNALYVKLLEIGQEASAERAAARV